MPFPKKMLGKFFLKYKLRIIPRTFVKFTLEIALIHCLEFLITKYWGNRRISSHEILKNMTSNFNKIIPSIVINKFEKYWKSLDFFYKFPLNIFSSIAPLIKVESYARNSSGLLWNFFEEFTIEYP